MIKRYLVVDGAAKETQDRIINSSNITLTRMKGWLTSIGATHAVIDAASIIAVVFPAPPIGKEWAIKGTTMVSTNPPFQSTYTPNKRTKRGRELAIQMQELSNPYINLMLLRFFNDNIPLQYPVYHIANNGNWIISFLQNQFLPLPTMISGMKEINEGEFYNLTPTPGSVMTIHTQASK